MKFNAPVEELPIQKAVAERLRALGIEKVSDLLFHFPVRHEDRSSYTAIKDITPQRPCWIVGEILDVYGARSPRKRVHVTELLLQDNTGAVKAVWFGQQHLAKQLRKGQQVSLFGTPVVTADGISLKSPEYEIIRNNNTTQLTHTGRIVPIYPETSGITSRMLRWLIQKSLNEFAGKIPETLPARVLKEATIPDINTALSNIHFPSSSNQAEEARQRFQYEDLLLVQLSALQKRAELNTRAAPSIPTDEQLMRRFSHSLSFTLTDAQKRAAWQIISDMEQRQPMNRLLQGDVGSGKTVVAALAALLTVKSGLQVALMAPTEVLAKQHFREMAQLLGTFRVTLGLLTGSQDHLISKKLPGQIIEISRQKLIEQVRSGEVDLLIGTHTLITGSVTFAQPGLIILDEQHRFGVEQRSRLTATPHSSAPLPHLLSMTATPIPRTLALTVYGDLDMSIIDELPPGRKGVITEIGTEDSRSHIYEQVRQGLSDGGQMFVICPRIEVGEQDDEELPLTTVQEEVQHLSQEIFPEFSVASLHGRQSSITKEQVMRGFERGDYDILVSTSVVEVGVDIPNANIMIVENAERFGLAQLHQLRGRIGRGERRAYCYLFSSSASEHTKARLNALVNSADGFELAEQDMKIRGPGSFFGTEQSGLPDLAMEALSDVELAQEAKQMAHTLVAEDGSLMEYPYLRQRVDQFRAHVHTE